MGEIACARGEVIGPTPEERIRNDADVLGRCPGEPEQPDFDQPTLGQQCEGAVGLLRADPALGVMNAGQPDRQPGWDLTFSAPKSVSLLCLYGVRRCPP